MDEGSDLYVPDVVPAADREYCRDQPQLGNRVGWGETPAVLVVDATEAFLEQRPDVGAGCVDATAELVDTARDAGVPVVYAVPNDLKGYPDGYPVTIKAAPASERGPAVERPAEKQREWAAKIDRIVPELAPADDETVVEKPRASAFFDTHLANYLHHYGVDTLVVAGTNTSGCIRATVVDSHSSNFRTIVPPECVADTTSVSHEVALFDMDLRYADVTPVETVCERLEARGES